MTCGAATSFQYSLLEQFVVYFIDLKLSSLCIALAFLQVLAYTSKGHLH